ncbi:MAG: sulfatase [Gemmatimonadales bacterium]
MTSGTGTQQVAHPGRAVLLAGLWFGLALGFIEAGVMAVQSLGLGRLIHVSWYYAWMAPAADLLFFAAPAALLSLAAAALPRFIGLRAASFVFLGMSSGALLLLIPSLHPAAAAVLAAGIAWQGSAFIGRRSQGFARMVRRTLPWMGAAVLLLAAGLAGYGRLTEGRARAALGPAPEGAPNVLLIILDTVRAPDLSLYGYQRETTPALARFAAGGARYDQAISTAPWTLPSHASLLTGRWPHELSADWAAPLDGTWPTLAEYFAAHGYLTGGFVANVGYCSWEFGLERGFARYRDFPLTLNTVIQTTSIGRRIDRSFFLRNLIRSDQHLVRVPAPTISREFLSWADHRGERPFFAFLNYYDAHGPYLPPAPYDSLFSGHHRSDNRSPIHRYLARPRSRPPSPEAVREEIAQYDGALRYLDDQLDSLFRQLERRGLLDNTIVLLTADHGEEFGEHGIFDHGNSLYRPSVHVPLLIRYPRGVPAGTVIEAPASLRDVPRTLAELAGLGSGPFPGRSLARFWHDGAATSGPVLAEVSQGIRTPEWYPVSRGDMQSLVALDQRYIRNGDGREELYRFTADPWEARDLASSDSAQTTLDLFRRQLEELRHEP